MKLHATQSAQNCAINVRPLPLATPSRAPHRPSASVFEIGHFGAHWPDIHEDVELAGLLLGPKAPGAPPPEEER